MGQEFLKRIIGNKCFKNISIQNYGLVNCNVIYLRLMSFVFF